MSNNEKNHSRRKFLDKSVIVGTGLALGLSALIMDEDPPEKIKMITLDGKLVEVESRHINKMCAGRVSNATLKKWIDNEKNNSTT